MATVMDETTAVGRRKTSTARVRLRDGSGHIRINDNSFESYFPAETTRGYVTQPLEIAGVQGSFDICARVRGGGGMGQAGALRHAIARALAEANPELRSVLKESGMLRRDPRAKERKKYGQPGARKKPQYSKR